MRGRAPCHIYTYNILTTLVNVVSEHRCDCIALSGGIDSTMILLAATIAGLKPHAFTSVYAHGLPKDLAYVNYVSKMLNVDVEYIYIGEKDLENMISEVVKCIGRERLNSHGDGGCIEIRNDVVFYATLSRAKDRGCKCVYVGSGGDELFAGYSFMLNLTEDKLEEAISRLIHGRYPELEIAKCLGVEVVAPFINSSLVKVAMEVPITCLRSERMLGKEVLRQILMDRGLQLVAERVKTPAESGAGTFTICRTMYDVNQCR